MFLPEQNTITMDDDDIEWGRKFPTTMKENDLLLEIVQKKKIKVIKYNLWSNLGSFKTARE